MENKIPNYLPSSSTMEPQVKINGIKRDSRGHSRAQFKKRQAYNTIDLDDCLFMILEDLEVSLLATGTQVVNLHCRPRTTLSGIFQLSTNKICQINLNLSTTTQMQNSPQQQVQDYAQFFGAFLRSCTLQLAPRLLPSAQVLPGQSYQ